MKDIKHIIFDLGGVLLNIDYARTEQAFSELGFDKFSSSYSQAEQVELFNAFEKGEISETDFVESLKVNLPAGTSDEAIINAWNAMLLTFPLRRLQILQQLQLHYDIVLLSNTNSIHEKAFSKLLREVCGFQNIGVFFDKVFMSHHIGMRKPDVATFNFVLEQTGFDPQYTLFLDDSLQHIEGAKLAGIQTIWMEPGMTIEETIFKPKE